MTSSEVQIRQCTRVDCGLRYPVVTGSVRQARCPRCRAETRLIQARPLEREPFGDERPENGIHLEAMLDNIRSAWNVGAMFRIADGIGMRRVHLAGITATPENASMAKTALGAEKNVAWSYYPDGVAAATRLREQGLRLWALELAPGAEPLDRIQRESFSGPTVLVVGNEISGVDPGILELCERIVYLPMFGGKRSLNVAVAFGIAAYTCQIFSQGSRSRLPNT